MSCCSKPNPSDFPMADDPAPPMELLVDRISDLPEPILLHILSFLPTHKAAQTSCLSHHFGKLWTASPSLHFDRTAFSVTARFVKMVDRVLSIRDRFAPLERVCFETKYDSRCLLPLSNVLRWFCTIGVLGVRHLKLSLETPTAVLACSVIFSIKSLESLHISTSQFKGQQALLPVNIGCTRLRSLYAWVNMSSADLTWLIKALPVLEDLELRGIDQDTIDISSQSVKRLKLHCNARIMKLCFPNLDFLHLLCKLGNVNQFQGMMPLLTEAEFILDSPADESMCAYASMLKSVVNVVKLRLSVEERTGYKRKVIRCGEMRVSLPRLKYLEISCRFTGYLTMFQLEMPLLRRAELYLWGAREQFTPQISCLLRCIEKVVHLKLSIWDHEDQVKPFHFLEPNEMPPFFPNLVNFNLGTPCHQATIEDVISLLENSPVLNSLQMRHQDPNTYCNEEKKKAHWQSKLPRNSAGNYQHACFTDLYRGDEKSRVIKLLLRRLTSKKRKRVEIGSTEN